MKNQWNYFWSFLTRLSYCKRDFRQKGVDKAKVLDSMAQASGIGGLCWMFDYVSSSDPEIARQAARSIATTVKKMNSTDIWTGTHSDLTYLSIRPENTNFFLALRRV